MPSPAEIDRAIAEVNSAVQRLFELGLKVGAERERARIMNLMQTLELGSAPPPTARPKLDRPTLERPTRGRRGPRGDALVTSPVRITMREIGPASAPTGVDAPTVTAYCNDALHRPVTKEQVSTALKVLARRNELLRVSRGFYLPGPLLGAEEEPERPTPRLVNLELPVEAADPARKAGGT